AARAPVRGGARLAPGRPAPPGPATPPPQPREAAQPLSGCRRPDCRAEQEDRGRGEGAEPRDHRPPAYNVPTMFRILDRYMWAELLPPFAIGVGVFTFFLFIDRIYQLTNLVITKNVPIHLVLSLLGFMLPPFLTLTLPLSLLVAVLLVGGRLAGDFEVTAIRAAGISPLRLFRPFVIVGVLVTGLIMLLTVFLNPLAIGAFQQQLFKTSQTRAITAIKERTFNGAFGQIIMYIEEIAPSQLALRGVLVSDEREPQKSRIILAREGRLLSDEGERRLTLRFIDGSIN